MNRLQQMQARIKKREILRAKTSIAKLNKAAQYIAQREKVEKSANFAAQAIYAREISKLFLVLAKVWEAKSRK